jgi:hypothetical protein
MGTSEPAYTLHVVGNAYATNFIQQQSVVDMSTVTNGGSNSYYDLAQLTGIVAVDCPLSTIIDAPLVLTLPQQGLVGGMLYIMNITDPLSQYNRFEISTNTILQVQSTNTIYAGSTMSFVYISTILSDAWYRMS